MDRWDLLIQATAILTGRRHSSTPSAYNPARSLGAALFDAGVSELSLARLLTTSPAHRRDQVIRVCRRLSITNHTGCDLRPLARFILDGNDATAQQINREYYGAAGVARLKLKEASS